MSPSAEPEPDHIPEAIVFWPWARDESAADTLRSALRGLPATARVLLPTSASGRAFVDGLSEEERARLCWGEATELPAFIDQASEAAGRADVVLIADACELPAAWLHLLRAAAAADDELAGATALVVDGDDVPFLEPLRGAPAPGIDLPGPAPASRVIAPFPHCTLLRRSTLDLVGPLEATLTDPAVALESFAARALEHGLSCALAADLVVARRPGGLEAPAADQTALAASRHPWLTAALTGQAGDAGPLRAALVRARARRRGLSVTVDARTLGHAVGGTPTYVEGLVLALAASGQMAVRAVVHDPPDAVSAAFAEAGVETITYHEGAAGVPRTDVVHRPQQIFTTADLRLAWLLGERLVISQMDLISYRTPSYHQSVDQWQAYRRATRLALSSSDRVVFFSEHGRRNAIDDYLVPEERATVAGIGITAPAPTAPSERPAAVPEDRPLLLLLGSDYAHKNRPFAMRLVDELRRRHDWTGLLVLAGAHVEHGSSREHELELLRQRPGLAAHVVDLGRVSEGQKRWLLHNADAHMCASNYEGFGLAPLEAATVGRPCIYAPCTSLREIIDPAAATIVPWDPVASADAAASLLRPGEARERHLSLLSAALERYRWEDVAGRLRDIYADAVASRYTAGRSLDELRREELIVELEAARADIQDRVAYGRALVDRQEALLSRAQQRGLMRVASRRWLRGPLLAPFALLGRDERDSDVAGGE